MYLTKGEQTRDFIYIDDVVSAYEAVIKNLCRIDRGFIEFQVGTGKAVSLKKFVRTVLKITNSDTRLLFGALPYRKGEIMYSKANNKALKELNWEPKFDISKGIRKFIEI